MLGETGKRDGKKDKLPSWKPASAKRGKDIGITFLESNLTPTPRAGG